MESVGALVNTEHEIDLDKFGRAGDSEPFCHIGKCIAKDYYCSFYSVLEHNLGVLF